MSYFVAKLKTSILKPIFKMVPVPTPITYIGEGKINEVVNILAMKGNKKALIITDEFLLELGLLDSMLEKINDANIETVIYSGVKPDPTFAIVNEALLVCSDCDAVVAVGGGSVIDTAKVVAAAASNGVRPEKLEGLMKVKKPTLDFICVPTTAGTGSEATIAAVISDTQTHKKTTIVDAKIVPSVAILDPALTIGLPVPTTVFTTMDALTHALEAYVSGFANKKTNGYAEIAIRLIYQNLRKVYDNPQDMKARENLLVASLYAGMAFTQTYVGYVHAFSHNIGGKYGVAHGLGNAVLLPHVMDFHKDVCEAKFARLADLVGISDPSDSIATKSQKFIDSLYAMNESMGVPTRLDDFEKSGVEEIVAAGFKEAHGTYPVPKFLSKSEAIELLNKVCKEN